MLTFLTWLWGEKYGAVDLTLLAQAIRRNTLQPHRLVCVIDDPDRYGALPGVTFVPILAQDQYLTRERGCFVRLRAFDPNWQREALGVGTPGRLGEDDRLALIDLDCVVTGQLDPVFDRPEPFVILQGVNAGNPCPYNGSLMMLRPGAHSSVWTNFSLARAHTVPSHDFPDDQGWIAHMAPHAAGWFPGPISGVYAFQKKGWPGGTDLPPAARLVAFFGYRKPSQFRNLPWVRRHWLGEP